MRYSTSARGLVLSASIANAFPAMGLAGLNKLDALNKRASLPASGVPFPIDPAVVTGEFNAEAQYVSNKGQYAFVAPGPTDARGPCPGLNAMANHGYIPHNGVATIEQFIQGTYQVFGMGLDLAGFLAVYGAIFDGDLTSWSIGGPVSSDPVGTGLIGSHNKYEADVSPVRPDLFEYGNNYKDEASQWNALYNTQAGVPDDEANYNLAVLQAFRSTRFEQSISQNPYFFNGPFSGVLVQPAAYTFIYRFMSNKSAEHPDGVLNRQTLQAFYGYTENSDGTLSGGFGQEYIPDNWYKRAIGDEYTIPFFMEDVIYEATLYPKFLSVGGNTGTVNSFTGLDFSNLTGGLVNGETILQGDNLFCFAYQSSMQLFPDSATKAFGTFAKALEQYAPEAAAYISNLGCPQLATTYEDQLEQFPGYVKGGNVY